jgi:hypothetical protein
MSLLPQYDNSWFWFTVTTSSIRNDSSLSWLILHRVFSYLMFAHVRGPSLVLFLVEASLVCREDDHVMAFNVDGTS